MASMQFAVLLLSLSSFFAVFAEDLETLPPSSSHYPVAAPPHHSHHPHPHPHPYLHPPTPTPTPAPAPAPAHHHHHHHHHHHSPASAPTPAHHYPPAPTPSPVVKPPAHQPHYPPPPSPPVKPPATPAPVKPPSHHYPPAPAPAPVKPPTHHYQPPTPAPHLPPPVTVHPLPRSFVAVQGVVYCKSCKYAGVDTLLGATAAPGAVVKLLCNNTRYHLIETAKTDKNGYFYLQAPKTITTFGAHKCKVFLVSSPSATCQKPSNLHGGIVGAILRPEKPFLYNKLPFLLYTVGPLAFEPKCPHY